MRAKRPSVHNVPMQWDKETGRLIRVGPLPTKHPLKNRMTNRPVLRGLAGIV